MNTREKHDGIYRLAFHCSVRAAALVDDDGRVFQCNDAFLKTTRMEGDRLPEEVRNVLRMCRAFQVAMEEGHARFLLDDPDTGRDHPATLTRLPEPSIHYLLEYHAHYEETHLETALQESERRFFRLQQNLPVGIYRADREGNLETVNPALLRMTGYDSYAELQIAELADVWVDLRERGNLLARLAKEGAVIGHTVHLRRKDGTIFIGSFDARGTFDDKGDLLFFDTIVQDITEKVEAQRQLERLARTDSLTGLNNRQNLMHLLETELHRSMRYKNPFTLLMLDLDHFKRFNDTLGHQTGDRLLREFAWLMVHSLRETDFAGRYGGEEFCVALPETDLNGGVVIAERIRKFTEQHLFSVPNDRTVTLTCSIGVAQADSPRLEDLIETADSHLYQAKRAGRNQVRPSLSIPT